MLTMTSPLHLLFRCLFFALALRLSAVADDAGGEVIDAEGEVDGDADTSAAATGDGDGGDDKPTSLDAVADVLDDDTPETDNEDDAPPERAAKPDPKKPAEDAAKAPEKADDDKGEAKKDDDPAAIFEKPEGIEKGSKAGERWDRLVGYSKQSMERAESLQTRVQVYDDLIQYSGATPDEFADLLDYSAAVKSGTPEGLQRALSTLDKHRKAVCEALGIEREGVDLLDEFGDLRQRVQNMELTRADALTIANARRRDRVIQGQQQEQHRQHQTAQEWAARRDTAVRAISAWEAQMQASDINYAAFADQLAERAEFAAKHLPPETWLADAQQFYTQLVRVAGSVRQPPPRSQQPLRASRAGGGRPSGPRDSLAVLNDVLDDA